MSTESRYSKALITSYWLYIIQAKCSGYPSLFFFFYFLHLCNIVVNSFFFSLAVLYKKSHESQGGQTVLWKTLFSNKESVPAGLLQ